MPRKTPGPRCVVCEKPSVAKGLCDLHYRRLHRHGGTSETLRPADWGEKSKHPLWERWKQTKRCLEGRHSSWNDFWTFVKDAGPRPEGAMLRRLDEKKEWSKENFFWKQGSGLPSYTKEERAAYSRAWRSKNLHHVRDQDMRRRYGIGLEDYDRILESQGGGCAICGKTNDYFALSIDHCHERKHVRGILCANCNRALGLFNDNPDVIDKASKYIRESG